MKIRRPQLIFLGTLILVLFTAGTYAQDAGMSDAEMEAAGLTGDEKVVYAPGEDLRYIPKAPASFAGRDSVALYIHDFPMQQAAMKAAERSGEKQPAKAKDDSILTYNFLYYIIQKYKLQDIID